MNCIELWRNQWQMVQWYNWRNAAAMDFRIIMNSFFFCDLHSDLFFSCSMVSKLNSQVEMRHKQYLSCECARGLKLCKSSEGGVFFLVISSGFSSGKTWSYMYKSWFSVSVISIHVASYVLNHKVSFTVSFSGKHVGNETVSLGGGWGVGHPGEGGLPNPLPLWTDRRLWKHNLPLRSVIARVIC